MIARTWHAFTNRQNAELYQQLLETEILPGIERSLPLGVEMMMRDRPDQQEVEFLTICYFESWDEVKRFAGEDYQRAVVPMRARALLKRFDPQAEHFEVRRHARNNNGDSNAS